MCSQSYGAEHSAAEMFQNSRPSAAQGHLPARWVTCRPRGDVPTSPQLSTPTALQRLQCSLGLHPSAGTNIFLLWGLSSQLALKLTWNFRSPTTCSPACFDSWNSLKGLKCGPCMFIQHLALCQDVKGVTCGLSLQMNLYSRGRDRSLEQGLDPPC